MRSKGDASSLGQQLYKFGLAEIILALVIVSSISFARADSINPGIYSKDSAPFGIPYKVWITRWWQWNIEIPKAEHPRLDPIGEKCAIGQEGPVWFLTDLENSGKVERTCTIPTGKAILFPVQSGECDYGDPTVKTDSDLRQCTIEGNDYAVIGATVDGVRLKDLEQYRIQSDFFNITIPADNIYDVNAGTFKAMSEGFFVFLEPLSPGRHDIHFTTNVLNPVKPSYNHAIDTTYHLIVK